MKDPTHEEVQESNRQFMETHRTAMQQWYDKRGTQPPVFKDDHGRYYWANRRMRKAEERMKKKVERDFAEYLDGFDLIQPEKGHPDFTNTTGNGPMYTGEAHDLLGPGQLKDRLYAAMWACYVDGFFYRTPTKKSPVTSFDDLFVFAATSGNMAQLIMERIKQYWGFYPTFSNPHKLLSKKWWRHWGQIYMRRFPHFTAHCKFAYGKRPNWFEIMRWKTVMIEPKKDQDGWRKSYFMHLVVSRDPKLSQEFAVELRTWEKNLYSRYPEGIGQCRGKYFGNPMHPNARYAMNLPRR